MFINKRMLSILTFFSCFCLSNLCSTEQHSSVSQQEEDRLKIHLICYKNGVGLNQDIDILMAELTRLGHQVEFIDSHQKKPLEKADLNIFADVVEEYFFPYANKNYLIPNPDWCFLSVNQAAQFDKILCKTKDAERIYQTVNANTVYLGFTSKDQFDPSVTKDYRSPLHVAGASIQKGTDALAKCWVANPLFPTLTLLRHKGNTAYPEINNLKINKDYLTHDTLKQLQNAHGLHICPSEAEGFGHYLMEALSCGSVVVTTDAPPMNEFITDKRCLVGYHRKEPWRWATRYFVDPLKLEKTITQLLDLPLDELSKIGKKNREFYLENDRLFKKRIGEIFVKNVVYQIEPDPTPKIFAEIYRNKAWGESPSGEGSMPQHTKVYRHFLQDFLKDNQIKQVIDVGCGDWQISELMDWSGIKYTGFDVYEDLIAKNQERFSKPNIEFVYGNATHLDLPQADLLICKDVLQHLPYDQIHLIIPQFKKYKHCLITNDVHPETLTTSNWDIAIGGYRYLDLTQPPFNLKGQKVLTFISGGVTKQVLYIRND